VTGRPDLQGRQRRQHYQGAIPRTVGQQLRRRRRVQAAGHCGEANAGFHARVAGIGGYLTGDMPEDSF